MPGIVAVVNDKNGKTLLESMINSVMHENWYLVDSYIDEPTLAVGRVHLGVFNPESQPIFNEDGSLIIVMDGEIYDYHKVKKNLELKGHKFKVGNDPEFILHLFEEYGEDFVRKLNGSFVIVIYDAKKQRIIVVNDRHGLRPFYYAQNGQKYLFASEVKAILQDKTFKKKINHAAVADFFAFERILGDKTFFKGINVLPPASILVWSNGKLSKKQYWDFEFKQEYSHADTEEYYVKNLVRIFRKAVRRRMKGKHRFGVFLSGGLDSRSIAAAIDKKHYPIHTFTYGVKEGDEAKIAENVAKKLGTEHKFLELKRDYLARFAEEGVFLTDGMCNCFHFFWISLRKRVKEDVDVVFHGMGLGVSLGGFYTYTPLDVRKILKAQDSTIASLLYRKLTSYTLVTDEMMPHFFSNTYYQRIKGMPIRSLIRELKKVKVKHPANKWNCFFHRNHTRYHSSVNHLRRYLEDRVPAYDNDFVDFCLKIPPELLFEHKVYYKFFTKLAPDLAAIPYQKTGVPPLAPLFAHRIGLLIKGGYKMFIQKLRGITGGRVLIQHKIGYPDLDEWIRKDKVLRKFFEDILLNEKTMSRGYFNREYITQIIKEHMSGKKDYARQLCALLTFELWHRLFVDETPTNRTNLTEK